MAEDEIEMTTSDGTVDAVLYHPDDGSRLPGVVFFTDIGGIRPSQREKAAELAAAGYVVLMPNVFYRTARSPVIGYPLNFDDDATMQRVNALREPLTPDALERDAAAYVDFLGASDFVAHGPLGIVGYCFTGKLALIAAAVRPERVGAGASFHGGYLVTGEPSSPHLLLPRVKASLYFGHATEDRSMPAEAIATLDRALEAWGGRYESEVYDGARHSWTEPDSPAYNEPQARRAFEKLTSLFAETLRAGG
jgi:carboxymethylenebutenolidase